MNNFLIKKRLIVMVAANRTNIFANTFIQFAVDKNVLENVHGQKKMALCIIYHISDILHSSNYLCGKFYFKVTNQLGAVQKLRNADFGHF